jgi:hypothetical protein
VSYHVVPRNDLKGHPLSPKCWCAPTLHADGDVRVWVHHAADMREYLEEGATTVMERPRA